MYYGYAKYIEYILWITSDIYFSMRLFVVVSDNVKKNCHRRNFGGFPQPYYSLVVEILFYR